MNGLARLVRVELARLGARRLIRVVPLLLLGAVGLAGFVTYQDVHWRTLSPQQAEADYQLALAGWEQYNEEDEEFCRQEVEARGVTPEPGECDFPPPDPADYVATPFDMVTDGVDLLWYFGALGLFVLVLLGASAVAAEFSERSIGTWLTFEPRRGVVYLSKLLAPSIAAIVLMLGYLALVLTVIWLIVTQVGGSVVVSDWGELVLVVLRSVLLGAVATAIAAGLAFLLRRTAAILGLVIGYLVVFEAILASFLGSTQRYMLSGNAEAWVKDGTVRYVWSCPPTGGACTQDVLTIDLWPAGLLIGSATAVVVTAGWLRFRRSDVD